MSVKAGDDIHSFGRIMVDDSGHCRVELKVGVQPGSGDPRFQSRFVMVDMASKNPAALEAFRSAVEAAAALEPATIAITTKTKAVNRVVRERKNPNRS